MNQAKPKILILFYSMYGHIFHMAKAAGEGVSEEGGNTVFKQIAELIPEQYWDENIRKAKETMKDVPVADPRGDLQGIDGIIVLTPTRFGNMASQKGTSGIKQEMIGPGVPSLANRQPSLPAVVRSTGDRRRPSSQPCSPSCTTGVFSSGFPTLSKSR